MKQGTTILLVYKLVKLAGFIFIVILIYCGYYILSLKFNDIDFLMDHDNIT
jgi:hypothetical protein